MMILRRKLSCVVIALMAMLVHGGLAVAASEDGSAEAQAVSSSGTLGKADGYQGIWYFNQPSKDEYVYKYSGGLGTYCAKHLPFAVYRPEVNKTFFCYGGTVPGKRELLHMVSYYDHATGLVPRPTILLDKETDDAHDNPVIQVDREGYVWIFSSSHGTSRPSYISRSIAPYSIDAFERVLTTNFSYPQPHYIPEKGFVFVHTRYDNGRVNYCMTSADGRTWSEPKRLAKIAQGHYQVSNRFGDKVGTTFNYHPEGKGLNWRTNLYYMESLDFGETWRSVRGEVLDLPLTEIDNPAIVHDWESEGLNVYMKDLAFDSKGNPIILVLTSKGYESGPANDPRLWRTVRWTGEAWDIQGTITSDNNYDTGSLYVERDAFWRLIGPTQTGPQPYNPGGEVAMWTSEDQGQTWQMVRPLTHNSEYNHTYVRRPVNAHPDFYAFWADGHGRRPSESRLYFCDKSGEHVWRLPFTMDEAFASPEPIN
ncbi:MAG TPA: BNR-4 repeat-containing protein [Candidatus Hydrogenedentes bacterium]|nr:BNR-4 repeat-containing protein [Candidatus Hydrogenedentota bacterium]HPG70163.1 BNR-4 repeat-containing protein [Candidatus Hydrogenedentota bacterium]